MQPIEPDSDLGSFVNLGNDEEGRLLVNVQKADEFDPRYVNDIEGLIFLGRLTSDVNILGHQFTLKTLTRGERLAITLFIKDFEDTLGLADALNTGYLSLAILAVDGHPLTMGLSPEDERPESRIARAFPIVAKWYDPLLEAIFVEYQRLVIRQAQAFMELEGKYKAGRTTL